MQVDTDVLVVGAGPTGLMMASQLARRGVLAMIVDRHGGPAQQSRAMAVQARTLEIYAQLGIAKQALERGAATEGGNIWAEGSHKARIPVADMGKGLSPFPFILMLGQDENELILGEKLHTLGVAIHWNTELVDLVQHADHVSATLRQPDGSARTVTAAWVAGCDGSRSAVREKCGITFPGAAYEHTFFVADTVCTGAMVPTELNVYLWKEGFHLFFPMRGTHRWRVIGILPAALRDKVDLTFEEVIPDVRKAVGSALEFQQCLWFSSYRIHHRAAARFRDRRCFLLGDAAHVHSPMGAQGMNTGLQDAYNLAWKLALVVRGAAEVRLLDSYEAERMPVARRLLESTDRAFTMVVADTRLASMFRTRIMANIAALAMRLDRVKRLAFRTISQIAIEYRHSLLSRQLASTAQAAPHAGDRFPWLQLQLRHDGPEEDLFAQLDDRAFNLLVMGQPVPAGVCETNNPRLRIHAIPSSAHNDATLAAHHMEGACFYLLRPDGHVGLAGGTLDGPEIGDYLRAVGVRAQPGR